MDDGNSSKLEADLQMNDSISIAVQIIASTTPLVVVGCSLVILHFYFKLSGPVNQRKLVWWDDFCLLVGLIFFIASFAFILLSIRNGYGSDVEVFSDGENPYLVIVISIAQTFLLGASTVTKMSLALLLMRFKNTPIWRAVLVSFVAMYPAAMIGLWIPVVAARQSGDPAKMQSAMALTTAILSIVLATTVLLTSLPTIFFMTLPSPHPSKRLAITLAVLGVLVSTVHVSHMILIQWETSSLNPIPTYILPVVGATLLIATATAPTLLGPMMRALSLKRSSSSSSSEKSDGGGSRRRHQGQFHGPLRPESRHLGLDGLPDNPRISVAKRAAGFTDRWSWFSNASRRQTQAFQENLEPPVQSNRVSFWGFLQSNKNDSNPNVDNRFSWLTFRSLGRTEREANSTGEPSRPGTSGSRSTEGWRSRMSRISMMSSSVGWGREDDDEVPPVPALPIGFVIDPPGEDRRGSGRSTGSDTTEWRPEEDEMSSRSRGDHLTIVNN